MIFLYRLLWTVLRPLIPVLHAVRMAKGKEDAARKGERYGIPSVPRPEGTLVWLHGASVGESLSLLVLIDELRKLHPAWRYLVTTGTVTSAVLMAKRLPSEAIHQYIPYDHQTFVRRFVRHWRPNGVLWCESEIWPNVLNEIGAHSIPAVLLNARMSARSVARWKTVMPFARRLFGVFSLIAAQTSADADRCRLFTNTPVLELGNLKFTSSKLPVDTAARDALATALAGKKVWAIASTHEGEEILAADLHWVLSQGISNIVTIIVPRHPLRADEIAVHIAAHGTVTRRSAGELPTGDIYVWDTMGELGTLFDVVKIIAMGGSFVPIGGHNPIEPAQFGCAVVCGPHMYNFNAIMQTFENQYAILRAADAVELAEHLKMLWHDDNAVNVLGNSAAAVCAAEAKSLPKLMAALTDWQKAVANV